MPGAELQVACKELREAKDWLAAIQKKSAPPSPHKKMPIRQEPMDLPDLQRGESEAGDWGNKMGDESDDGKTAMPPQSEGKRAARCQRQTRSSTHWQGASGRGLVLFARGERSVLRCMCASGSSRMDSADTQDRAAWCSHP